MRRAKRDTYISLFNKSDNVNLDKTFDRKSVFVHVLIYGLRGVPYNMQKEVSMGRQVKILM